MFVQVYLSQAESVSQAEDERTDAPQGRDVLYEHVYGPTGFTDKAPPDKTPPDRTLPDKRKKNDKSPPPRTNPPRTKNLRTKPLFRTLTLLLVT